MWILICHGSGNVDLDLSWERVPAWRGKFLFGIYRPEFDRRRDQKPKVVAAFSRLRPCGPPRRAGRISDG